MIVNSFSFSLSKIKFYMCFVYSFSIYCMFWRMDVAYNLQRILKEKKTILIKQEKIKQSHKM
jgi:hypothetical protein